MRATGFPSISVVIPARDEAATVAEVVRAALASGAAGEVLVVDDGSSDGTVAAARRAGAEVVPTEGGPGKGQALWAGVAAAAGEVVVFLDADLVDPDPAWVPALAGAVADGGAVLAKAAYARAGAGGRVTELTAGPALQLLFPELAHVTQPLAGEFAARREALLDVPFVHGYGVDLGLVLDLAARHGAGAVTEVDLGERRHRNRPLGQLRPQATDVLAVALHRAGVPGVTVAECPPLRARLGGRRTA